MTAPFFPYRPSAGVLAIGAVIACTLIWGTTWYAITLQFGSVAPIASISYRFGLAALVLVVWCLLTRRSLKLTRPQHMAAIGQGLFVFGINYAFVYWSEQRVASAVVAVIFAGLAFLNLIVFRAVAGQKASRAAWGGAVLGIAGVAVMFAAELVKADLDPSAALGLLFALIAVISAAIGNLFAWRGQMVGAQVLPLTAWGMAYGTVGLVLYGVATGVPWTFDTGATYVLSLLYLSLFGSVIAFVLYFNLARSRGYALASYISALTPPVAMVVSVLFEDATFGLAALGGLALVLAGQAMLIRAPKIV